MFSNDVRWRLEPSLAVLWAAAVKVYNEPVFHATGLPMNFLSPQDVASIDQNHIWHPYSSMTAPIPAYQVDRAEGCRLILADGRELVDGMSSWWCAIHGYNHPRLNAALQDQLTRMAHVMFGGIVHEPAARLCRQLVELTPAGLDKVFLSDSGSVSVEVAIKMAMQYQFSQGRPRKTRLVALRNGYHGDTFGAMAVCDPVTGMHHLFSESLPRHFFVERPACRFGEPCGEEHIAPLREVLERHHDSIAALILEPIVQGTGGLWFYSADYLRAARELCDRYDVLLIADEVATGFGRTGKLFACEWAGITPDILCIGKALTGGYMTLAATLCTRRVSDGICTGEAGVLMHGPTFMGNPLACAVACASIELLQEEDWQGRVRAIEAQLRRELAPCAELPQVAEVRVLGAIGVVELLRPVDLAAIQRRFVDAGVWVRPFGTRVYLMPPFVIGNEELGQLTRVLYEVVAQEPFGD